MNYRVFFSPLLILVEAAMLIGHKFFMCIRVFLLALLFSLQAVAGTNLNTLCTKSQRSDSEVEGLNINRPYTIASVTKVFTAHWAVNRLGPKYRYPTIIHITPVANNLYDVHLEGSLFPYFDKTLYQFLVGELNSLGVKRINFLTYDENLLYATNVRTDSRLAHGNDDLDSIRIMKDLRKDTVALNTGLKALNAKAFALEGLVMPSQLVLSINDIHFLEKNVFQKKPDTISFLLNSSELYRNLKEMNRNSHNFAADRIFQKLAAVESYSDFIFSRLNSIAADEIRLFNGSGYPVFSGSQKMYNEASCAAVVEMMNDFRQQLRQSGLDCKDVMPVAGKDSVADGDSTVTLIYNSEQTSGALVGKTGSVSDTIALAGVAVTENENTFFHTSYFVDQTPEDRALAYNKIKTWLATELFKDKKKSDLNFYQPKSYMAFDAGSKLQRIDSLKLK